jgi:hypothetical protein
LVSFQARLALIGARFLLVACLAYYSNLKMEAMYTSETSVNFNETILRHIAENGTVCLFVAYYMKSNKLMRLRTAKLRSARKITLHKKIEERFVYT